VAVSSGGRVLSGLKQVVSPVTGRTYELMFVVENGKEIVLVNEAPTDAKR
jgi:hypothetical protein